MLNRLFLFYCFCLIPLLVLSQRAQPAVDFIKVDARMTIDTLSRSLHVKASYLLEAKENTHAFYLDAQEVQVERLRLNKRRVQFENDGSRITIDKKIKAGRTYMLVMEYAVQPSQTVYFVGWDDGVTENNQIWTQGQGKYTSHWLPSLDDMNDKMVFQLEIGFDPDYTVLSNGKLQATRLEDGIKYWSYDMELPMSSYLVAFAVGMYNVNTQYSASGIPLENYYYTGSQKLVEPTYRYTQAMFDFLEAEIGAIYPWQTYKQVPVRDFLYAGMENTGLTIFSDDYIVDSLAFSDKNYIEVNAHEMAHQWFGNLVTEQDSRHHWLHEGFATYYALLAEREVMGEATYYWKLFDKARALKQASDSGNGQALTDPNASSLTFYDKGAWALVVLRELVGDNAFQKGVQQYLERHGFGNATVADFLQEISSNSDKDLSVFRKTWLESTEFSYPYAIDYLRKYSNEISEFLSLQHEVRTSSLSNAEILRKYWKQSDAIELKRRSLSAYFSSLPIAFIKEAFASGIPEIRQAIALSTRSIPIELKAEYESLLSDPSYRTQEQALYLLWVHFPEERTKYLDELKGIQGFADRNVEQLWLLLASLTPDFETKSDRDRYRKVLSDYTSGRYPFQVRQRAFALLAEIQRMGTENLKDLIRATVHPQYAFRTFARDLLGTYLEKPDKIEQFRMLAQELKPDERRYIEKKLTTE